METPRNPAQEQQLRHACAELDRRLRAGEACQAETVLSAFPTLAEDEDAALELAYTEFAVREELGQRPVPEDWYQRFPQWVEPLQKLFHVHQALQQQGASALVNTPLRTEGHDGDRAPSLDAERRYVLFEELGRGGMGVVYKARQPGLGRTVALKMILTGEFAQPDERARFRREAEETARLQHPNIVPIYEVGEQDGQPFLALEYVDGGSLDRKLAGTPLPARDAAQLVQTLAGAMQYAHEQGIIHRDLKPANILLSLRTAAPAVRDDLRSTGAVQLNECVPKITDFGLAKRLEATLSHNGSGEFAGTPSYMAPEQASGQKGLGPAADVYALGAILYECLTGRPPFRAETIMETLLQVRSQEPVACRRLQPQVPRDLETICLKCLHKEPRKRYARAADLAEDLARWSKGIPIKARPVRSWERTWKWMRRRPAAAALVGVSALSLGGLVGGVFWHNRSLQDTLTQVQEEKYRAEENLDRTIEIVDSMLADWGARDLASVPNVDRARRALLEQALLNYQRFLPQRPNDPALHVRVGKAYEQIGLIQRLLGRPQEGVQALRQGVDYFEERTWASSGDASARTWLAASYHNLARHLEDHGNRQEAVGLYAKAIARQEELVAEFPREFGYLKDLAKHHTNLGILLTPTDAAAAQTHLGKALEYRTTLHEAMPQAVPALHDLARSHLELGMLGHTRSVAQGDRTLLQESVKHLREALRLERPLHAQQPAEPEYREVLARTLHTLGNALAGTDRREAAQCFQEALALREKLLEDFRDRHLYQFQVASTLLQLGNLAHRSKSPEEQTKADLLLPRARTLLQELVEQLPEAPANYHSSLALSWHLLGQRARAKTHYAEAAELLRAAVVQERKALERDRFNPTYGVKLRNHCGLRAALLVLAGNHAEAARAAAELTQLANATAADAFNAANYLARCAQLAHEQETLRRQYTDQAVAFLRAAVDRGFTDVEALRKEKAFNVLHPRKDFQELETLLKQPAGR